jgi:radical SAM superfamily enzyme YgiQ (UPF0313 family)
MRVAVIVVWRPKGITGWEGRDSEPGLAVPKGLSYDRSCAPFTGTHLASLLPAEWEVQLIHECVQEVDLDMEVDAVILSTMDYCADHARNLGRGFRRRGVRVIVGGLYPTVNPGYFAGCADAVAVGEAEPLIDELARDLERGELKAVYRARGVADLAGLPVPRYDLVEPRFLVPCTYEATRGCPFKCSFCILSGLPSPYRRRPIANVIRDLRSIPDSWSHYQKRFVFFLDNNLGADRRYFADLCAALVPLRRRVGTQTSIDTITPESARMMGRAGFQVVYIGLESLSQRSLEGAGKRHNRVSDYKRRIGCLHDNGVLVMSIFLVGLDGDTPEYLADLPNLVHDIGVDLPVFSFPAPLESTPLREALRSRGRLLAGDLNFAMDGSHLVYRPEGLSADELEAALLAYSPGRVLRRVARRLGLGLTAALFMAGSNLHYHWYERAIARSSLERLGRRGAWPGEGARFLSPAAPAASRGAAERLAAAVVEAR